MSTPTVSPTTTARTPAERSTRTPLFGFAVVLGAATLFGMLGPLARFAYEAGMDPGAFVAWRALIGLLGLLAYVAWRLRRGVARLVRFGDLSNRTRFMLFVAGVTGFTLNLSMFIAFDRITIALALLGFYTYPAMVAVANVALGRERLDRARIVALGLAIVGMIAVVASQLDPQGGIRFDVLGVALALGAAVSQTVFVVISRDGYSDVPTEQAMSAIMFITVVGSLLLAVVGGSTAALLHPFEAPSVFPLLVFTGLAAAAVPSLAFLTGIRLIGGTRAGILMLFEPVVGVALAAWLLAEPLVAIQLAGAAAILAAAVVLQRAAHDEDGQLTVVPGGP